jgi:hypothetical protein
MTYKELKQNAPAWLYDLAVERADHATRNDLKLSEAFFWYESPEGIDFWRDVNKGIFKDPPIKDPKQIEHQICRTIWEQYQDNPDMGKSIWGEIVINKLKEIYE